MGWVAGTVVVEGGARVYFKFAKRRRIKGAFEEVLTVPMSLRIGPRTC